MTANWDLCEQCLSQHLRLFGAGSVITKNVEPYCVVAGNPARIVKEVPDVGRE